MFVLVRMALVLGTTETVCISIPKQQSIIALSSHNIFPLPH